MSSNKNSAKSKKDLDDPIAAAARGARYAATINDVASGHSGASSLSSSTSVPPPGSLTNTNKGKTYRNAINPPVLLPMVSVSTTNQSIPTIPSTTGAGANNMVSVSTTNQSIPTIPSTTGAGANNNIGAVSATQGAHPSSAFLNSLLSRFAHHPPTSGVRQGPLIRIGKRVTTMQVAKLPHITVPTHPPLTGTNLVFPTIPPMPTTSIATANPTASSSSKCQCHTSSAIPITKVSYSPYVVKAVPPKPPSWDDAYQEAIQTLQSYYKIPIDINTLEYNVLAEMIIPATDNISITNIERIVNPELWKRFLLERKSLLCAKTDDLELLHDFGLTPDEIQEKAHVMFNFSKDASLDNNKYSDNMVLLFHCSRAPNSIQNILSQGLDERVGAGGLLGRGIYFADDPRKAMQYDANKTLLIFAVILGDCLCVDQLSNKGTLVREPPKEDSQKRNHTDLFFDSIVGAPGSGQFNEYVIYNRSQCCPLYAVTYQIGANAPISSKQMVNHYTKTRGGIPQFAWSAGNSKNNEYLLFAQNVFKMMGVKEDEVKTAVVPEKRQNNPLNLPPFHIISKKEEYAANLKHLENMGFIDSIQNQRLLLQHNNDLQHVLNVLLDQNTFDNFSLLSFNGKPITKAQIRAVHAATSSSSSSSTSVSVPVPVTNMPISSTITNTAGAAGSSSSSSVNKPEPEIIDLVDSDDDGPAPIAPPRSKRRAVAITKIVKAETKEDCTICFNEYDVLDQYWKVLECTHKICHDCYARLETTRTTVSGIKQTYVKCPFCNQCTGGYEIGDCPAGKIDIESHPKISAAGYERDGVLSIRYRISSHGGLDRTGYLPNNSEGQHVALLLKQAWDRRLTFSIGTSMTTGAQNALVWNIHHKTSLTGGVQAHGYPDPTYLDRVKLELRQYGLQ